MKAIILISSIFYILGLKISNKIDFVKKAPVKEIITKTITADKPPKAIHYNEAKKSEEKKDSISGGAFSDKNQLNGR